VPHRRTTHVPDGRLCESGRITSPAAACRRQQLDDSYSAFGAPPDLTPTASIASRIAPELPIGINLHDPRNGEESGEALIGHPGIAARREHRTTRPNLVLRLESVAPERHLGVNARLAFPDAAVFVRQRGYRLLLDRCSSVQDWRAEYV
jgi:hypothetical protein